MQSCTDLDSIVELNILWVQVITGIMREESGEFQIKPAISASFNCPVTTHCFSLRQLTDSA